MTHDKLDNLLKQWASHHVIDEARSSRLASQIAEELAQSANLRVERPRASWGLKQPRRRLIYAAMATAAALLLAVVAPSFFSWRQSARNNEEAGVSPVAPIGQLEIEAGRQLFCEVEKLFGDQLRWVAENQSEVRLDVRRTSGRAIAEATPLLIRVVVVKSKGSSWVRVLETNILARSEELVELAPDPKMAGRLTLWGYPLPDGKIALDASIWLSSPICAGVDVTNILDPGKPKKIFTLKIEGGEYRVYEMVTPLADHTGVSCSTT